MPFAFRLDVMPQPSESDRDEGRTGRENSAPSDAVQRRALGLLTAVLAAFAFLVFLPCSVSLILASWFALLTRPWEMKLSQWLHGRTKAAAVVTSAVVVTILGPVIVALVPVVISAVQLASEVRHSEKWRDAARSVVGDGANDADLMKLVRGHASSAWDAALMVLSTSATLLFGIAMFVVSLFAFSTNGEKTIAWLRAHSPLKASHFNRIAGAYAETGRGLIIGVGVTALIQGAIATATYAVVGIPRALALGLLTTVGALIPGIGTLTIWGPVTLILGLGGYPVKAAIVGLSGVLIIGSVDNFIKPILSNRAHLHLPPVLVFITMLSGIVMFGPAGLLLGPLFVRVAMEALAIAREERLVGPSEDRTLPGAVEPSLVQTRDELSGRAEMRSVAD
jgi:predicted PurR-regulated permease PerM